MMMVHRDNNHHRSFLTHANANAIGFGDVDAGGPTGSSSTRPKTTNTYDVFASSDSGSGAATGGGTVGVRTLQPFTISPTINSIAHTAPKSPVEMASSLEYPFTSTQWKELERQAMIYKYMKASIPVPPDLLVPLARTPSLAPVASHSPLGSDALNLRFSNRGDLEPGRCRRTDGKKWRCSRDVAPGQKYCERHMHRGRPRSRKPVELPNKKNRHTQAALPSSPSTILNKNASPSQLVGTLAQPFHQNQPTCFLDKTSEKDSPFWPVATVSSCNEPRSSDWIFNEELFPLGSCDPELQHLMQLGINTGSSFSNADESSVLNQNYNKEPLSLSLYSNYRATEDQQTNCYPLFLNSEIVPLEKSPEVAARGLIGAWSNHHSAYSRTESTVSSKAKFSLSSLSLSMGVDHTRDDSMGPIHMGLGASECDQNHEYAPKSHPPSWLSPASWATSTPGGPLAEVLKPSKITTTVAAAPKDGSNPSSPVNSPPLLAVSSTSDVLQRTFASLSDSSASSSPTLTSSGAKPEIGLMWLKGNY